MLEGGSPRKELFADEKLAHALPDDKEHFADLVGVCEARLSPSLVGGNHIDQQ
jgi:hypothetical protein